MGELFLVRREGQGSRRSADEGRRKDVARAGLLLVGAVVASLGLALRPVAAQTQQPELPSAPQNPVQLALPQGQAAPPLTITLQDAIERARRNDADYLSSIAQAKIAQEATIEARGSVLPTITGTTQYLGTQGNGKTPSGRFVTNDGVHVYRAWGVLHQNISATSVTANAYQRSKADVAIAKARLEIAQRGLTVTVTRNFYGLVVAQHKYANAQQAVGEAQHFLTITQDQERVGQAPHSDVVKAQIQYEQQMLAFEDAGLAMEDARLNLAVLLFPVLNENFTVADDIASAQAPPGFGEVQAMAEKENPDVRVAFETLHQANLDVFAAKSAFLPSLAIDTDYGIEANSFALRSVSAAARELGPLPNLGYFLTANLSFPVWDWGVLRSRLHQTQYKQEQARAQLTQTQRILVSNLYMYYNEVLTAQAAVERTRHASGLAAESLRLINLRYQAGTSSALEVVDATTTLTQARNSSDDTLQRYRVALATLQTLTGSF